MSTADRINKLRDGLLSVTPSVCHAWAYTVQTPYIVWMTDGAGDALRANGMTEEQSISGTIHLFEPTAAKESNFAAVQKALNAAKCAWRLVSIQHEQETGISHYEWSWEVC